MDYIQQYFNAPLLFVLQHIFDDQVCFINDFVYTEFLEGQLFRFNHGLDYLNGVSIESGVVDQVVLRYLAEEVELFQQGHEDRVPVYYGREELETEEGHWVVVGEDDAEGGEEVFKDQVVDLLGGDFHVVSVGVYLLVTTSLQVINAIIM